MVIVSACGPKGIRSGTRASMQAKSPAHIRTRVGGNPSMFFSFPLPALPFSMKKYPQLRIKRHREEAWLSLEGFKLTFDFKLMNFVFKRGKFHLSTSTVESGIL